MKITGKGKKGTSIEVAIRMRPLLLPFEDECAWKVDSPNGAISTINNLQPTLDLSPGNFNPLLLRDRDIKRRFTDIFQSYSFRFDNVFGQENNTQQIYCKVGRKITKEAMNGYNGTVLVYGQTTSGKTYTMLGTPENPGILPCALRDIFKGIASDIERDYTIWVSYMEIYNEIINDLLIPGSTNLKIKEDSSEGVIVAGLKKQQIETFEQAIVLLNYGEEHRCYRETSVHEHSSRSHTIFKIYMEISKKGDLSSLKKSCLNLVDLAGSERLNEFTARGETIGEAGHINKSLFVLANVVNRLAEGKCAFIPYRDSKLTRILSMALGGNSLTSIICTISPAIMNFHQTLSTLRFATRAKVVETTPKMNEFVEDSVSIAQLQAELQMKDEEIQRLQRENQELRMHSLTTEKFKDTSPLIPEARASNETNFMENLISFINSLIHSSEEGEDIEKIDPEQDEEEWSQESTKLVSLYKIELLTLQNRYRDMIREICSKYAGKNLALISTYLTTANAHEKPIGEQSEEVIYTIKRRKIFDEIQYDLESLVTQEVNLQEFVCDDRELVVQLLDKVKDYKEHILEQLDEVYENIKFKLESYYRNKVKKMKEQLALSLEAEGELNPAAALTMITNEHHDMLVATREQYEAQMTKIEQSHQALLQKLMRAQTPFEESESSISREPSLSDNTTKYSNPPAFSRMSEPSVPHVVKTKSVLRVTPISSMRRSRLSEN